MIQYFFDSLMGVLLLCGLMTFVVGSVWVLTIAVKELLNEWGIEWKSFGMNAPKKSIKKLSR